MIMSETAFTIYQYAAYIWFCVGAAAVGFVSIRDLVRMIRARKKQ